MSRFLRGQRLNRATMTAPSTRLDVPQRDASLARAQRCAGLLDTCRAPGVSAAGDDALLRQRIEALAAPLQAQCHVTVRHDPPNSASRPRKRLPIGSDSTLPPSRTRWHASRARWSIVLHRHDTHGALAGLRSDRLGIGTSVLRFAPRAERG